MRRTVVICDLHAGTVEATGSLVVLVDQVPRRLDVCDEHLTALRGLPRTAVPATAEDPRAIRAVARRPAPAALAAVAGPRGREVSARRRAGSRRSLQAERAAARDWARSHGHPVSDRGRLPAGLLERYRGSSSTG